MAFRAGTRERTIYFNDEYANRIVKTYDDNGNPSTISEYEIDSTITKKDTFEYQDNILIQKNTNDYAKGSRRIFLHNAEGFPIQTKIWEKKGGIEKTTVYEFQYIFDDFGNWVRRITYENNNLYVMKLRKIEYY